MNTPSYYIDTTPQTNPFKDIISNEHFGYIIALFFKYGSYNYDYTNDTVSLLNVPLIFKDKVYNYLSNTLWISYEINIIEETHKNISWNIQSKNIKKIVLEFFTFTENLQFIPEQISIMNPKFLDGFIAGLIDTNTYIRNGQLAISSVHPIFIKQIQHLFNNFGIHNSIFKDEKEINPYIVVYDFTNKPMISLNLSFVLNAIFSNNPSFFDKNKNN